MNATQIRKSLPDAAWRRLEEALGMPALLVTPARALDDIQTAPSRLPPNILEEMTRLLGEGRVHQALAARAAHMPGLDAQLRLRQGDAGGVPDAVLRPADSAQLVALLRLCADAAIAVGPLACGAADAVHVALDLSSLDAIEDIDTLSGQVRAGGGLGVAALDSALTPRGLMLECATADPLMTVAAWTRHAPGLRGARLVTPQGPAVLDDDPGMAAVLAGGGVVTAATLAVRRRPAGSEPLRWCFPDFAAGLAALREAAREGLAPIQPHLSDDQQTALFDSLEPEPSILAALWARLRKQRAGGASLSLQLARGEQAQFKAIATRLGAWAAPVRERMAMRALAHALLERGAAMDQTSRRVSWAKLPGLYAAARAALDGVMAQHAPREGARGLVLASVDAPDAHGANLTLRWIYARKLDDEVAQAESIHARALQVMASPSDPLAAAARAAMIDVLDPKGIVRPLQAPL